MSRHKAMLAPAAEPKYRPFQGVEILRGGVIDLRDSQSHLRHLQCLATQMSRCRYDRLVAAAAANPWPGCTASDGIMQQAVSELPAGYLSPADAQGRQQHQGSQPGGMQHQQTLHAPSSAKPF
jgi:hypothetical protein